MPATLEIPEVAPKPLSTEELQNQFSSAIEKNLCAIYLTVSRPTGRPQSKNVEIEVPTDFNDTMKVQKDDLTNPCWKIDINKRWKTLDLNSRAIKNTVELYAISDSIKGEYLVSMLKAPELLARLTTLRDQRREIAQDMIDHKDEMIDEIRSKFPNVFETQIKDRINFFDNIERRFGVLWVIKPLTPMGAEELDLSNLSQSDATLVIKRTNEMAQQMAKERFQNVFDTVFGEVLDLCGQINSGEYGFKRRTAKGIEDLLGILERVKHFDMFASKGVLESVAVAQQTISKYKLDDIKGSELVQSSIRDAFRPLAEALTQHTTMVGAGRAKRSIL